jgi:hypothetical protein
MNLGNPDHSTNPPQNNSSEQISPSLLPEMTSPE